MRRRRNGLLVDIAKGIVAGAGAGWLMNTATTLMYQRQAPAARHREEQVRGGKQSFQVAAEKLASLVGRRLDPEVSKKMGNGLHWAIALGAGATYGALRGRVRWLRLGGGLLFGALVFALIDEGANTVFGLTPGPRAFPWQAHARGLLGHLTYGAVADAELRLLDRALT